MIKRCSRCEEDLDLETSFYPDSRRKDGYYAYCKSCHKQACLESQRKKTKKRQQIIEDLRKLPCFDCERSYPPHIMILDHPAALPKAKNLLTKVYTCSNEERFCEEVKEHQVVCSNCHRERTHQREQLALLPPPKARPRLQIPQRPKQKKPKAE